MDILNQLLKQQNEIAELISQCKLFGSIPVVIRHDSTGEISVDVKWIKPEYEKAYDDLCDALKDVKFRIDREKVNQLESMKPGILKSKNWEL